MKWGVRKDRTTTRSTPMPVNATASSVVPGGKLRKTKIKTEGGENQPAHEDALKVAASRAKLSKSGVKALSNKELRDLNERLRLEEQATQLTRSKGKKFVTNNLINPVRNEALNEGRQRVRRRVLSQA